MLAGGPGVALEPAEEIIEQPAQGPFTAAQTGGEQPLDGADDHLDRQVWRGPLNRRPPRPSPQESSDLSNSRVTRIERPWSCGKGLLHQEPAERRLRAG